jgi:hypothetical protein
MTAVAFAMPSPATIAAYEAEARRMQAAAVRGAFAALIRRIATTVRAAPAARPAQA